MVWKECQKLSQIFIVFLCCTCVQEEEETGIERDQTDSERRADEETKELAFQQAYVIVLSVCFMSCGEQLACRRLC